mgnify:CR=1 FL=1
MNALTHDEKKMKAVEFLEDEMLAGAFIKLAQEAASFRVPLDFLVGRLW